MAAMEPVELSFFTTAPSITHRQARLQAPRAAVFTAIAEDPAGWGRWFPGFSNDGHYETPEPYGVGSVRVVRAFGIRYRETVLAWDEGSRWAFRVEEASAPGFAAFAEDYHLDDDGSGTVLTWTVAFRPDRLFRPLVGLAPLGFGLVLKRAAASLQRVVAQSSAG